MYPVNVSNVSSQCIQYIKSMHPVYPVNVSNQSRWSIQSIQVVNPVNLSGQVSDPKHRNTSKNHSLGRESGPHGSVRPQTQPERSAPTPGVFLNHSRTSGGPFRTRNLQKSQHSGFSEFSGFEISGNFYQPPVWGRTLESLEYKGAGRSLHVEH